MKRLAILFLLASCTKATNNIPKTPSVSYTFADNKMPNGANDTLADGSFSATAGGNTLSNDTSHGFVFFASGPNGSSIVLSYEIPQLTSGTYTYEAFSPSWPLPLGFFQWTSRDWVSLHPISAHVTVNFSRYSNKTADGTFSLNMSNGPTYVTITNGVFRDIPVTP